MSQGFSRNNGKFHYFVDGKTVTVNCHIFVYINTALKLAQWEKHYLSKLL